MFDPELDKLPLDKTGANLKRLSSDERVKTGSLEDLSPWAYKGYSPEELFEISDTNAPDLSIKSKTISIWPEKKHKSKKGRDFKLPLGG